VLCIPSVIQPTLVTVPSKDPEDPNTACETYIQCGKDNVRDRVLMDLLVHIMDEPIHDQIRTKDQFGYDVYCDTRWSYGIIGCRFHVTTNVKSAADVVERIDRFLTDFRQDLADMSEPDFREHLIGLAKQKLDMFNSLSEETESYWDEIRNGRFEWEAWRNETVFLRGVSKNDVINAYDDWLRPGQRRKILAVQVIGGAGDTDASNGRPVVKPDCVADFVDEQVEAFHKLCKKQTWGRVNSKLF
jgi:secreted Zn-dependent insulinase-like peptidase